MMREKLNYMVWTGCAWWPTRAVSEKKAIANVEHRMREKGKCPVRSEFKVKRRDEIAGETK